MTKNFTIVMPDEPYKNVFEQNTTVNCTYNGPRYLAVCINNINGKIYYVDKTSDKSIDDLELDTLKSRQDNAAFIVVDSAQTPIVAAILQSWTVTHEEIADYEEVINENMTYTFSWGNIISWYDINSLKYINNTWTEPLFQVHDQTKEKFNNAVTLELEAVINAINNKRDWYTDDQLLKLQNHKTWLESLPIQYADVDPWKIQWPTDLPSVNY